jgi:hypothetical protein
VTAEERAEFVALRHVLETYALGCQRQSELANQTAQAMSLYGKSMAYQHAADTVAKILAKTDRMARAS